MFGRKETCLNTLRLIMNSQSHIRTAPAPGQQAWPWPVRSCQRLRGEGLTNNYELALLKAARRTISVGYRGYSIIKQTLSFFVDCSNMYNWSINELYILLGNLYICSHNRKVCVRMVILFYPATRACVHFTRCDHCVLLPLTSGAGPARWLGRS